MGADLEKDRLTFLFSSEPVMRKELVPQRTGPVGGMNWGLTTGQGSREAPHGPQLPTGTEASQFTPGTVLSLPLQF